jgi:tetratricopeptide (TPR) repeat protein
MGRGTSVVGNPNDSIEKINGDLAFQSGKYLEAIIWYSIPLSLEEMSNNDQQRKRIVLLSNRSAAYTLTGFYHSALVDAQRVIELDPLWSKGYFRAAKVLHRARWFFLSFPVIFRLVKAVIG